MNILNTLSLKSNSQIKINFDGGDLSSDAGLLLIKEFVSKIGIDRLFSHSFKTNDSASFSATKKINNWPYCEFYAILVLSRRKRYQYGIRKSN